MLLAALLLAATAAEIPVGAPPTIGGAVDGMLFDGSHFVLLQRGVRTSLANDGTPLSSSADDGDRVALASSGRGSLSISIAHGGAYVNGTLLVGPADAAAVAWDGTRYVLAWRDGHRLVATTIGENGGGIGSPIDIAGDAGAFALAARDGVALVTWSANGTLFARTLGGATSKIGDGEISDVAAGRDGFLIATLSARGELVAQHVDLAGQPDASYAIAPSSRGARVTRERYAYALVWPDGNRLLGERIDPFGGTRAGPFVVAALNEPIGSAAIAATSATTLVAYASASGTFAKPIDDTLPGNAMPAHAARQSNVHAGGSLVVWQQETPAGSEIRVNDTAVASGALEDVAFDNGAARIVFRDDAGLWSLRFPIDAAPSPAEDAVPDSASTASNGSETLVVRNDDGAIVAERAGSGERIVVDGGPPRKGTPHVRWDGAAFVVSWPEVVDGATAGFASMRIGGTKTIVARAPLPISLDDWSADAAAVYYIRNGRLFMQRIDAARRRAAGR